MPAIMIDKLFLQALLDLSHIDFKHKKQLTALLSCTKKENFPTNQSPNQYTDHRNHSFALYLQFGLSAVRVLTFTVTSQLL